MLGYRLSTSALVVGIVAVVVVTVFVVEHAMLVVFYIVVVCLIDLPGSWSPTGLLSPSLRITDLNKH